MDHDSFMGMSHGAQLLYVRLVLEADDDGFVQSAKRVMRVCEIGSVAYEELKTLRYLLEFDSGICVIKHWGMMNKVRSDSYKETSYTEEKALLAKKNDGSYTWKQRNRNEDVTQYSIDKNSIEQNKKQEDEPPAAEDAEGSNVFYAGFGYKMASLLRDLIQANNPSWKSKPKHVEQWARDIDKIVRIDGRTEQQVEYMVRWVQADGFWQKNILSGSKLREKFEDLVVKIKPQQRAQKGRGLVD